MMSTIGNISGLLPGSQAGSVTSSGSKEVDGSSFLSLIQMALGQSITDNAGANSASNGSIVPQTSDSAQDPQAVLQTFLHSLMGSLPQEGAKNDADDSTSTVDSSKGAKVAADIQGLLQQLSANVTSTNTQGSDPLGALNSSFQNLVNSISAQGQSANSAATLQSFLQNLYQGMGSAQSVSGTSINAKV